MKEKRNQLMINFLFFGMSFSRRILPLSRNILLIGRNYPSSARRTIPIISSYFRQNHCYHQLIKPFSTITDENDDEYVFSISMHLFYQIDPDMIIKQIHNINKSKGNLTKSVIQALQKEEVVSDYNKNDVIYMKLKVIFRQQQL